MKKFTGGLFIALLFEILTYYWDLSRHIESFFFVWAILYLGLLLFELFRIDTSKIKKDKDTTLLIKVFSI